MGVVGVVAVQVMITEVTTPLVFHCRCEVGANEGEGKEEEARVSSVCER